MQAIERENGSWAATSFKGQPGDYGAPYPQSASYAYGFWPAQSAYRGGIFSLPNGSDFSISWGELIPPPEVRWGEDVTITITCNRDTVQNELIFDFGPAGCRFNSPAKVFLDWSDLGVEHAKLYYIDEDGNYIEQTPDDIDYQGKRMLLYISHFSRYAVAFAN